MSSSPQKLETGLSSLLLFLALKTAAVLAAPLDDNPTVQSCDSVMAGSSGGKGEQPILDLADPRALILEPTIQLPPGFRDGFEAFDSGRLGFHKVELFGHVVNVYRNLNLNVVVTDVCDATCPFCIQDVVIPDHVYGKTATAQKKNLAEHARALGTTTADLYLGRLKKILDEITKDGILFPSMAITGGEPTMVSYFPRLLELIANYNLRKISITTNGKWLRHEVQPGVTILDLLGKAGIQYVNISHAHFSESENQKLMGWKNDRAITDADLRWAVERAKRWPNLRLRLNVTLLKTGIGTADQVQKFLNWASGIGIHFVFFREAFIHHDEAYAIKDNPVVKYTEDNLISLDNLLPEIDRRPEFRLIHVNRGYYYRNEAYDVTVSRADGSKAHIRAAFDRSDLGLMDRAKKADGLKDGAGISQKILDLVYHAPPSGELSTNWNNNRGFDILIPSFLSTP